ncbi:MAG: rubrerythrin family protein [Oscillibacter sp.]|nr:rubrerythrin family protein [Oscillibacter sp.]
MSIALRESETLKNLMKAFAGESQARSRYTYAAAQARNQNLHVVEAVFAFTANQEREHAEIFYRHMGEAAGTQVPVQADYPVDVSNNLSELLRRARDGEYGEADPLYPAFARTAREEGFPEIASSFEQIAKIERSHGNRFGKLLELMEGGTLFTGAQQGWLCLNCGHIHQGDSAPETCPVCSHHQGFFLRLEWTPYGGPGILV